MIARWYRELVVPAGLLASLIIGAGMFSLPYLFARSGWAIGFGLLGLLTILMTVAHLMYGGIVSETPGNHRFVGYAEIYLKRPGFYLASFVALLGILLTLTVYLVLSPSFMRLIFPSIAVRDAIFIFWALGTIPIFINIRRLAGLELVVTLIMVGIVASLAGYGLFFRSSASAPQAAISFEAPLGSFFILFGPALFALAGRSAISSVKQYFATRKIALSRMGRAIVAGTVLPGVVYGLFVVGATRLSSGAVSPDAVSGLLHLPSVLLLLIGGLGFFAIWTSYVMLGLEFVSILGLDFKMGRALSALVALAAPLLLYLGGLSDFLALVGIAGGVFLALEYALVAEMWGRLRRSPFKARLLALVFALGAVSEVWHIVSR